MTKGITLIELLVVISIILIFSTMVLINYQAGQLQFALQRSASQLAQDIRGAKEMAMSIREFEGSIPEGGYGIYLKSSKNTYQLYADLNANEKYDGGDGQVRNRTLEQGVFIKSISPNPLSINFKAPDPQVKIFPQADSALIILALESDPQKTKTIIVNKLGLITIE